MFEVCGYTGRDLSAAVFLIWARAARKNVAMGKMVLTTKHSLYMLQLSRYSFRTSRQ